MDGKTMSVADWSRQIGVSQGTIHARLDRGLRPETALHKGCLPRGPYGKRLARAASEA